MFIMEKKEQFMVQPSPFFILFYYENNKRKNTFFLILAVFWTLFFCLGFTLFSIDHSINCLQIGYKDAFENSKRQVQTHIFILCMYIPHDDKIPFMIEIYIIILE